MRYSKKAILERCEQAGVKKVIAANHHGMIFLLSDGPEQRGGIVWRNDNWGDIKMKKVAEDINEALEKKDKEEEIIREFLTFLDYGGNFRLMTTETTNHSSNDYLRSATEEERAALILDFLKNWRT